MDDQLQKAYDRAVQVHLPKDEVTGVMIGLKFKDGQWTDEQCISIRVEEWQGILKGQRPHHRVVFDNTLR